MLMQYNIFIIIKEHRQTMYEKENPDKTRSSKRRKMEVPSYVFFTERSSGKIESSNEIEG